MLELAAGEWSSGPLVEASTFWQRLLGLRGVAHPSGLLIHTRSVHTFGLRQPIGVVALDKHGFVLTAHWVGPRRVVVVARARSYVELRAGRLLPRVGERVGRRLSWPDERQARPVRNSDRQSV